MAAIAQKKIDSLEAERFEAMIASEAFAILRKRIAAFLDRSRVECESRHEPSALYRAQGAVAALRTVLDLPQMITDEMQRSNAAK